MFRKLIIVTVLFLLIPATLLGAAEKNANILMITWRGETEAEQGFKKGLESLGYAVEYMAFDAQRNKEDLAQFIKSFDRSKKIDLSSRQKVP